MGFWLLEMPINTERNIGFHKSLLPKVEEESSSLQGFRALKEAKLTSLSGAPHVKVKTQRFLDAIEKAMIIKKKPDGKKDEPDGKKDELGTTPAVTSSVQPGA